MTNLTRRLVSHPHNLLFSFGDLVGKAARQGEPCWEVTITSVALGRAEGLCHTILPKGLYPTPSDVVRYLKTKMFDALLEVAQVECGLTAAPVYREVLRVAQEESVAEPAAWEKCEAALRPVVALVGQRCPGSLTIELVDRVAAALEEAQRCDTRAFEPVPA